MNEYFRSTGQTEAHDASVIVYWGEPFDRPNVLIGVIPHERPICESCGDSRDPMLTLAFDMDDSIAEAFELAVAKWREHAETAARERPADSGENGRSATPGPTRPDPSLTERQLWGDGSTDA